MVRSLYTGISGLRSHQVALDVTGNNIANVNTIGFKSGRATFKESMAQLLQGPSRPAGNQGGTNPLQIGLGTSIGSIDTMLRQGNLQTTGQVTDLALEGRAYFAFSSGNATYYSRNGGLQLDAQGFLVSPTNGFRLQGKMADVNGNYTGKSVIGDLRIPWGEKAPAKATDEVTFACNLNSDAVGKGTVTHSNSFLANAQAGYGLEYERDKDGFIVNPPTPIQAKDSNGNLVYEYVDAQNNKHYTINSSDPAANGATISPSYLRNTRGVLTNLFDESGNSLGIKEGDTLKMSWSDSNKQFHFPVVRNKVTNALPTLEDLRVALQNYLNDVTGPNTTNGGNVTVVADPIGGGFQIQNATDVPINGLRISSDRAAKSSGYITNAFEFPPTIGEVGNPNPDKFPSTVNTPPLRIPAYIEDELANVFDASGRELGFENGDEIEINGSVGSKAKNGGLKFSNGLGYEADGVTPVAPATTMYDLIKEMQRAFGLPPTDGSVFERPTIEIKQEDVNGDGIPLGAIVIRGMPETAFALTGINVRATDDNHQVPSPTRFNTNMTFTEVQTARDTLVHSTSLIVFDEGGASHNVTMTFSNMGVPGEWMWELTLNGDEEAVSGNRGKLIFGTDGTPAAFTFDGGVNGFTFEPKNGASQVFFRINAGAPGSKEGITQFDSPTTTVARDQNGYPMGKLQEISIGEDGEITGIYTNSVSKPIAQIFLAEFNNPAGLMKVGDSMFTESNNSGYATMLQPKIGTATKVKPGALEMSNVELETEFTNMITIQRGYQANARVITTSDSLLQELVQLVR